MNTVLGITEGSIVAISLGVFGFIVSFIGVVIVLKARAEKSDIMIDVKKEISEKTDPIERRMDKHDADFKDFKHDEIAPMKNQLNNLEIKQSVIDVKIDCISEGIIDIKKLIGKIFDELENKADK